MTISKDLFLAILSMDAYNRGYNSGISGLGGEGSKIGAATIGKDAEQLLDQGAAKAVSFYAVAYELNNRPDGTGGSGVDGLAAGTTVISYRGTDNPASEFPFTDFPLSTLGQWRDPQIAFAQP